MDRSDQQSIVKTRGISWLITATALALAVAGCGDGDEASADDLIGTWAASSSELTWEFTDVDSITVSGGVAEGFTYIAGDTTLELTESPVVACDETGIYEWAIEQDVLTLTVVSDECEGRNGALDGRTFEREE